MKKLFFSVIAASFLSSACDPDREDLFPSEKVAIKCQIHDTAVVIRLGDTLTFKTRLPDTIISTTGMLPIHSVEYAGFGLHIRKLDTVSKLANVVHENTRWTSDGSLSPSSNFYYQLTTDRKPYRVTIHFKPAEKGIYYAQVVPQPGNLRINNFFNAGLVVDFNVQDKHLNLLVPFVGTDFISTASISKFGFYAFRVN